MADGLFSYKTPGQLQQDYLGGLMQPVGGGDLYSQLIQTMSNAGRIAGYGAGRMFGGQVPGEEKNAAIQRVFEQVKDIPDLAEQYNKAAELFAQSGFPDLAMQARKTAQTEQLTGYQLSDAERKQNLQKALNAIPFDATETEQTEMYRKAIRQFGSAEQQAALRKEDLALAKEQKAITNRATALVSSFPKMDNNTVLSIAGDKDLYKEVISDKFKFRERKTEVVETKEGVQLIDSVSGDTIKNYGPPAPPFSIVNAAETAESQDYGKFLVGTYKNISEVADTALKTKASIQTNLKILDSGFKTGFGTEAKAAAASVLAAFGVKDAAKFAGDAQTFNAQVNQLVLQTQIAQKGPQTEADARRITATSAQLGNEVEANKFILKVALAQANRDIAKREFYRKWRSKKGTFKGAEDAWFEGEGGESLFDRPELKEYANMGKTEEAVASIPTAVPQVAPMYARNPKTGQRIVSTDGGKTWQQAR